MFVQHQQVSVIANVMRISTVLIVILVISFVAIAQDQLKMIVFIVLELQLSQMQCIVLLLATVHASREDTIIRLPINASYVMQTAKNALVVQTPNA